MRFLLIVLVACFSGIFSGMGMGGGTFLVPALSIFFSYEQIICQSTNVFCFIIVSIVCCILYLIDKKIELSSFVKITIPAFFVSGIICFFSLKISSNLIKLLFAIFVVVVGIYNLISCIICVKKKR